MRAAKKLTVSAVLVALGTIVMTLGGVFGVLELSCGVFASLLVAFAYIELGSPYHWLVWLVTSVLTAVFFPGGTVWGAYLLIFGIYPIIKAYIERLRRSFWIVLKLLFSVFATAVLAVLEELILGVPLFGEYGGVLKYLLLAAVVLAIVLYDYFLTVMIRFYTVKYRKIFSRLLK